MGPKTELQHSNVLQFESFGSQARVIGSHLRLQILHKFRVKLNFRDAKNPFCNFRVLYISQVLYDRMNIVEGKTCRVVEETTAPTFTLRFRQNFPNCQSFYSALSVSVHAQCELRTASCTRAFQATSCRATLPYLWSNFSDVSSNTTTANKLLYLTMRFTRETLSKPHSSAFVCEAAYGALCEALR